MEIAIVNAAIWLTFAIISQAIVFSFVENKLSPILGIFATIGTYILYTNKL